MYVENGEKSFKGLGQMQGRQTGGGVGIQPHLICYYVQVISIWGGGVDGPHSIDLTI